MKSILFRVLVLSFISFQFTYASVVDELSPAELERVNQGKQVVHLKDLSGKPWPEVTIYQRFLVSPEEIMAVFTDIEIQPEYMPNVLKASVSKRIHKTKEQVDYQVDLPFPLSDESYTVENTYVRESNDLYNVSWTLVRADSTREATGKASFEKYHTSNFAGVIVGYRNLVVPDSSFAGPLKGQAIKQVKELVQAIGDQTLLEKKEFPDFLNHQISLLRERFK